MDTPINRENKKYISWVLIFIGMGFGSVMTMLIINIGPSLFGDAKYAIWLELNNPYPTERILNMNQNIVDVDRVLVSTEIQSAKTFLNYMQKSDVEFSTNFKSISVIGDDPYNYSIAFELRNFNFDECTSLRSHDGLYVLGHTVPTPSIFKAFDGKVEYSGSCSDSSLTITVHHQG